MLRPWDGVDADGWAGAAPVPRCPGGATAGGTRGEEVRLDVSGRTVDQNGGSNAHGTSFPSGRDPFLSLLQVLRTSFDWIREHATPVLNEVSQTRFNLAKTWTWRVSKVGRDPRFDGSHPWSLPLPWTPLLLRWDGEGDMDLVLWSSPSHVIRPPNSRRAPFSTGAPHERRRGRRSRQELGPGPARQIGASGQGEGLPQFSAFVWNSGTCLLTARGKGGVRDFREGCQREER